MSRVVEFSSDPVAHAAAEWVVRHDRGLTRAERTAFESWQHADPRNGVEYERIKRSWQNAEGLAFAPALVVEADAIIARARRWQVRRRRMVFSALAAAAMLALAFVGYRVAGSTPQNYAVLASTSREVRLPDGSVVVLNGDSRIETAFTAAERRVRLTRGEALFTIAKNPQRPFFVTAGPVSVRAVGTAFNVKLGETAVEVLVTHGIVSIGDSADANSLLPVNSTPDAKADPAGKNLLTAGHRIVVDLTAKLDATKVNVATLTPHEMEQELGWQSVRLVFNETPLDDVVVAFNRYNANQLMLGDPILRSRRMTGVFRADNVEGFARLLEAGLDVRVERRESGLAVLLPAN